MFNGGFVCQGTVIFFFFFLCLNKKKIFFFFFHPNRLQSNRAQELRLQASPMRPSCGNNECNGATELPRPYRSLKHDKAEPEFDAQV